MDTIGIYTTGGNFVEGKESPKIVSLIESLGVVPPWQACYLDSTEGILIHIFTAKYQESGSATRKANNYYIAVEQSGRTVNQLWRILSTEIERRLNDSESAWIRVDTSRDLKSPLSSPQHIKETVEYAQLPQSIPERAIAKHLRETQTPLKFGFETVDSLRSAVQQYDRFADQLVYGTQLKSKFDTASIRFQLESTNSYNPLDKQTAEKLEVSAQEIVIKAREYHIETFRHTLEEFNTRVQNDELTATEGLTILQAIQEDSLDHISTPEKESIVRLVSQYKECRRKIRVEANTEGFNHVSGISKIAENHVKAFESAVADMVDEQITYLEEIILQESVEDFETLAEREIAAVCKNINVNEDAVNQYIDRRLVTNTVQDGFVENIWRNYFGDDPEHGVPTELINTVDVLNKQVKEHLIPTVSETTGMTEQRVEAYLKENASIDSSMMFQDNNEKNTDYGG